MTNFVVSKIQIKNLCIGYYRHPIVYPRGIIYPYEDRSIFSARPFGPENSQKYIKTNSNPCRRIESKRMGTSWEAAFPSFAGALNFSIPRARNMRFSHSRIYICIVPFSLNVFIRETVPPSGNIVNRTSSKRGCSN